MQARKPHPHSYTRSLTYPLDNNQGTIKLTIKTHKQLVVPDEAIEYT